ncbi:TPA: aldo/keto reductase [Enterobacter hormaechei subsp. steigerwaltii]|nr:aldo/keto reductase [Enterobacter hormaechei subsp. steigerwaltii]
MKKLPKVALGTWSWGTGPVGGDAVFGNHLTDEQMKGIFAEAISHGLNLWDTAPVYGMGSSESALGNIIRQYDRDDLIISTKFTPQIANTMSPHPVSQMLEDSLKRLGTETIDIYWIHNPHDVEKWTPGLIPLLKSGQIKSVGVSNHNLGQIKRVNEILSEHGFKISAIQNHYSLLYRSSEDAGILRFCKENNITFYSYMVLEQGALSGRYNPRNPLPEGSDRAKTYNNMLPQLGVLTDLMKSVGKKHGAGAAEVAIAWAIGKGTVPIIGATKISHVIDAARAATIVLTSDEMTQIESLAAGTNVDTRGAWEMPMV